MIMLADNFSYDEMIRTSRDVDGDPTTPYTVDNVPSEMDLRWLRYLCKEHLQRIRNKWGRLTVTSGYRSPKLNEMVGGARDSAHRFGCAADIVPVYATVEQVWRWLPSSGLQYDQAIWEISKKGSHWLHYGIARPGYGPPRRQHFTIHKG